MPVLRHKRRDNFTIVPNDVFKAGLSLKAAGLLCLLLSLPEGWEYSTAGICAICPADGRDSVKRGLTELEAAHFLSRTQQRTASGKLAGFDWLVSDEPLTDEPPTEKPPTEKPPTEKPSQVSNHLIKNIKEKETSGEGRTPTRSRFVPPSVEEVQAYCNERGNGIDAQRFVDFYTVSGWKRGKTPIKDWQACVRTWEQQGKQTGQKTNEPDYTAFREESL